jgi:DNA polymerase III sliding clamp (beta) subunit (PCNA family)
MTKKQIKTNDLRAALRALKPALGTPFQQPPAVNAIRLEPGRMRAFNYETTVEIISPALAGLPRATINGHQLADVLNGVTTTDPVVRVAAPRRGQPTVHLGPLTFPIDTIPARDLPPWPEPPTRMPLHELAPDEFARIATCAIAANPDDGHPSLQCVQLADLGDNTLTAAATDRYRLAVAVIAPQVVPGWKLLIPARTVNTWATMIAKTQTPVEVWGPAAVTGEADERTRAWLRTLNALGPDSSIEQSWIVDPTREYPDVTRFANPTREHTATVDRQRLLDVLTPLAKITSRHGTDPLQLAADPALDPPRLTLTLVENTATGSLPMTGSLTPITVNPRYLTEIVRTLTGDTITIGTDAAHRPLTLTDSTPGQHFVLMPVRLRH